MTLEAVASFRLVGGFLEGGWFDGGSGPYSGFGSVLPGARRVGIGTTISNEGQIFYDSTGDRMNDMMRGTYPPGGPTAGAPTDIQVGVPPSIVPTTNDVGRAALFLILVGTPLWILQRRRLAPVHRGR